MTDSGTLTRHRLSARKPSVMESIERKLFEAEDLMLQGSILEPEVLLRDVIEADPSNIHARNDLACLLWQSGQLVGALRELSQALRIAPYNRDVVWNSGQIFFQAGQHVDAVHVFRTYLRKNPQDVEIAAVLSGWEAGLR